MLSWEERGEKQPEEEAHMADEETGWMKVAVNVGVWKRGGKGGQERREGSQRWPEHAALLVPTK